MLVLQIKQQYETTTAAVAAAVRVTIISCPLLCKFLHVNKWQHNNHWWILSFWLAGT